MTIDYNSYSRVDRLEEKIGHPFISLLVKADIVVDAYNKYMYTVEKYLLRMSRSFDSLKADASALYSLGTVVYHINGGQNPCTLNSLGEEEFI